MKNEYVIDIMTNKRQGTTERIFEERRINENQFFLASLMTMIFKYSHQDANKIIVWKQKLNQTKRWIQAKCESETEKRSCKM